MYDPNRDDVINECDSDNDSIYEDEDETTRIVPPSGMEFFVYHYVKYVFV